MKEKIIARLKAKYSGVNLSKTRLDQIADKLAAKISEETEIDAKLDELNEIYPFADIAKQDDKLRTLEAKHKDNPPPKKEDDPKDQDPPKPEDKDTPEWAKGLIKQNQELAQRLEAMEKGKTAEQQQSRLRAILKEKKVDEAYINDPFRARAIKAQTFKDDEELEAFAEEIVTAYTASNPQTKGDELPGAPIQGKVNDPAKEVSPMMKEHLAAKKVETEKK